MYIKPLILLLLFFAITPNLGFFTVPSFLIIASVLILMFVNTYFLRANINVTRNSLNSVIPYIFLILLFYSIIYYGGLYQSKNSIIVGYYIFGTFILMSFLRFIVFKKSPTLLLIIAVYISISFWTILNSPHPTVDTFTVLKEAPLMLLNGENPYASTFTQVYPQVKPDYYNYLPFSFFYAVPFVLIFSDPRYMIIFSFNAFKYCF